jgi:hypothetical protein
VQVRARGRRAVYNTPHFSSSPFETFDRLSATMIAASLALTLEGAVDTKLDVPFCGLQPSKRHAQPS